jgi:transcriptional regulator with XRE-family HTH domain
MRNRVERCHVLLGARIKKLRKAKGLTQYQLARKVGHSRASVANIETGRHRFLLNVVERFARVLGCTPKQLLKGIWW